ncbi:hypothetical protein [Lactiplantibacillus plantarum]|uniref:hypothetical protein n=1 Tax=Lactiplantibacillus plantarum TaxID=1590 RepID=UPI0021CB55F8|nr:hypothetical protein [Lactiplantibacillus plantarum]
MQYGQQHLNGHSYLFDQKTGAMQTGFKYISQQNKIVYYNSQGQMQYFGRKLIMINITLIQLTDQWQPEKLKLLERLLIFQMRVS